MKRLFTLLLSALFFTAIIGSASAAEVLPRDDPTYEETRDLLENIPAEGNYISGFIAEGSGCTLGADPIIADNSITFFLKDYIAKVEGRGVDRATCNIGVRVKLPPGFTILLDNVIYRGGLLGFLAETRFFREYFFADQFFGDRRFTVTRFNRDGDARIRRDDSDEYTEEFGEFTAKDEVLSVGATRCGETVVWRANTSVSAQNRREESTSQIAIDTIDISNEHRITFGFSELLKCQD